MDWVWPGVQFPTATHRRHRSWMHRNILGIKFWRSVVDNIFCSNLGEPHRHTDFWITATAVHLYNVTTKSLLSTLPSTFACLINS